MAGEVMGIEKAIPKCLDKKVLIGKWCGGEEAQ